MGKPFEAEGRVSIWLGTDDLSDFPQELDILQDLCGIGYYSIDLQDAFNEGFQELPVRDLLSKMSYSDSFADDAMVAADEAGLVAARWIVAQFDFDYDSRMVKRPVNPRAIFLGAFSYVEGSD